MKLADVPSGKRFTIWADGHQLTAVALEPVGINDRRSVQVLASDVALWQREAGSWLKCRLAEAYAVWPADVEVSLTTEGGTA